MCNSDIANGGQAGRREGEGRREGGTEGRREGRRDGGREGPTGTEGRRDGGGRERERGVESSTIETYLMFPAGTHISTSMLLS